MTSHFIANVAINGITISLQIYTEIKISGKLEYCWEILFLANILVSHLSLLSEPSLRSSSMNSQIKEPTKVSRNSGWLFCGFTVFFGQAVCHPPAPNRILTMYNH